jgi:hypothetical protein
MLFFIFFYWLVSPPTMPFLLVGVPTNHALITYYFGWWGHQPIRNALITYYFGWWGQQPIRKSHFCATKLKTPPFFLAKYLFFNIPKPQKISTFLKKCA